jgi:hypothetical protein
LDKDRFAVKVRFEGMGDYPVISGAINKIQISSSIRQNCTEEIAPKSIDVLGDPNAPILLTEPGGSQ